MDKISILRFLKRPEARYVLYFVLLYRLSEGFIKAMEQTFFVDNGLSVSAIGLISGGSAAAVGLTASIIAIPLVKKMGAGHFLLLLATLRPLLFTGYAAVAAMEVVNTEIFIALSVANTFVRYMEIVGIFNLCMQVCDKKQAGTDFTILSCANLFVYMCGAMLSGMIADIYGYAALFSLATFLSFIGVVQAGFFIKGRIRAVPSLQSQ